MSTATTHHPGTRFGRKTTVETHRVVVTGVGAVSSLGFNAEALWQRLLNGETGIRMIPDIEQGHHQCLVRGDIDDAAMPNRFLSSKTSRTTSRFARMAVEAAGEALLDAGLLDERDERHSTLGSAGVSLGSCIGGFYDDVLPTHEQAVASGRMRISPYLHVMCPNNLAAHAIHHRFSLHGPSITVVTACATGTQAIGTGFHAIKYGQASIMVTGASDSTHHPMFLGGFEAMHALATDSNHDPAAASRPFDASRSGFVLGEGAGILVLESLEHALARGARIYAEITGFASSNDAFHAIAPRPDGTDAARAVTGALDEAGRYPEDVDHINAHAASTPAGDLAESRAIQQVYGNRAQSIPVTSIKGAIGHCMAATGAIESVASVMTLRDGIVPPTRNYRTPDPEIELDVVHGGARRLDIQTMVKHSFGLGGQNACLVLERFSPESFSL